MAGLWSLFSCVGNHDCKINSNRKAMQKAIVANHSRNLFERCINNLRIKSHHFSSH